MSALFWILWEWENLNLYTFSQNFHTLVSHVKSMISHDHQQNAEHIVSSPGHGLLFLFVPCNSTIWLGSLGGTGIYINNKQEETIKKKKIIATINLRD